MKEIIILAVMLATIAFVPIETFTWRILVMAALETFCSGVLIILKKRSLFTFLL